MEEELLLGSYSGHSYSPEDDINTEVSSEDDMTSASSFPIDSGATDITTLRETITALDALMTVLFQYLTPFFPQTASFPTAESEHLFDSLLTVFLTRILPTHHSRHAQFLLFLTSQSNPLFLD